MIVHTVGDLRVLYPVDASSGRVALQLLAAGLEVVSPRDGLGRLPFIASIPDGGNPPARVLDSLVQIKMVGDDYSGPFAQGHTMRNAPSGDRFRYVRQDVRDESGRQTVTTVLRSGDGLELEHRLSWHDGDEALRVETMLHNRSSASVQVEMLSSFSLGNITPFHEADAPGRLRVHRFRSVWSAEGRLETRSLEDLHLERSWSGAGHFSERFGQVGSMPVRKWFPFVAVEDTGAGVVWAAQLAWAGSWQMEVYRQHDDVCLSGGLADREFGHWMKTVAPGETLRTPPAFLTCVRGGLDEACDRLTALQHRAADAHPKVESDLPIVFNEWCTTWGDPEHAKVLEIADRLKDSDVRYLVIDAGWFKGETSWYHSHGDWIPNPRLFPDGLEATAAAIRERGLIPGLWFEMEVCGKDSAAFSLADHLLKRDGLPITVNGRRFWDLNDPWVIAYLSKKVIGLLERGGFGYLKVDYNDTIGLGSDHSDGLGEGLRRQTEGIYRLFEAIRRHLPDLVIENCASGGHRLEPSMLAQSAMSSFSDAHELPEIPIIAASLHRLLLPRQSQIWAVLHETDSEKRLIYSLSATFLGRMCLSGGICDLRPEQWAIVQDAMQFYRRVSSIIKHGKSRCQGATESSWRYPRGWQASVRQSSDGTRALVVLHGFEGAPADAKVVLPPGGWRLAGHFGRGSCSVTPQGLGWLPVGDFSADVVLLEKP